MHGHYFLSYSQVDGRGTAGWLADQLAAGVPAHRLWLDSREIAPGHTDWDDQIDDAIRSCRGLLLVLTPDSVRAGSVCKDEWGWALLDAVGQQVVQALAVFPEPVPAVAVAYLLQPYRPWSTPRRC